MIATLLDAVGLRLAREHGVVVLKATTVAPDVSLLDGADTLALAVQQIRLMHPETSAWRTWRADYRPDRSRSWYAAQGIGSERRTAVVALLRDPQVLPVVDFMGGDHPPVPFIDLDGEDVPCLITWADDDAMGGPYLPELRAASLSPGDVVVRGRVETLDQPITEMECHERTTGDSDGSIRCGCGYSEGPTDDITAVVRSALFHGRPLAVPDDGALHDIEEAR